MLELKGEWSWRGWQYYRWRRWGWAERWSCQCEHSIVLASTYFLLIQSEAEWRKSESKNNSRVSCWQINISISRLLRTKRDVIKYFKGEYFAESGGRRDRLHEKTYDFLTDCAKCFCGTCSSTYLTRSSSSPLTQQIPLPQLIPPLRYHFILGWWTPLSEASQALTRNGGTLSST